MKSLDGLRVMVTRPDGQAAGLSAGIRRAGGMSIEIPALELKPVDPDWTTIPSLDSVAFLIFISANAVRYGVPAIRKRYDDIPADVRVAAIGSKTADHLRSQGLHCDISPESASDSESLLALPEFSKLSGRDVVIVKGRGGRKKLADTLRQRGASIAFLNVYERRRPEHLSAQLHAAKGQVDCLTVTSVDALNNLVSASKAVGVFPWLSSLPVITIGQRVSRFARELGFAAEVATAAEMSDQGFIITLKQCYSIWKRRI